MTRRIVLAGFQLFFTVRIDLQLQIQLQTIPTDSYTSTHFVAMREPQRRFQAFLLEKEKYFATNFFL